MDLSETIAQTQDEGSQGFSCALWVIYMYGKVCAKGIGQLPSLVQVMAKSLFSLYVKDGLE